MKWGKKKIYKTKVKKKKKKEDAIIQTGKCFNSYFLERHYYNLNFVVFIKTLGIKNNIDTKFRH